MRARPWETGQRGVEGAERERREERPDSEEREQCVRTGTWKQTARGALCPAPSARTAGTTRDWTAGANAGTRSARRGQDRMPPKDKAPAGPLAFLPVAALGTLEEFTCMISEGQRYARELPAHRNRFPAGDLARACSLMPAAPLNA